MIVVVGGGRMGLGLASAFSGAGERVTLWSRREVAGSVAEAVSGAHAILLAVPDDVLSPLAQQLANAGAVSADQVVLHLSGVHAGSILGPLAGTGAALGSLHPLQTISEPEQAAARWQGAYAAVEGDSRAVREADRLARLLGLIPVRIPGSAKAAYHAAAVVASNYVVVLAELAARIAGQGGVPAEAAARMYLPLLRGAAENLQRQSPREALTGPVRRGDVATIRRHLAALGPTERRLYVMLGFEALALARDGGLGEGTAAAVEQALREAAATGPRS